MFQRIGAGKALARVGLRWTIWLSTHRAFRHLDDVKLLGCSVLCI